MGIDNYEKRDTKNITIQSQREIMKSLDELLKMNEYERAEYLYEEAKELRKRLPKEYERLLKSNQYWAYLYCRDIIRGRWPEAEPYIMKDPEWAYEYIKYIVKGRWKEAESYIKKNIGIYSQYYDRFIRGKYLKTDDELKKMSKTRRAEYLFNHALHSKDRKRLEKKYEDMIKIVPECAYLYAKRIIKKRWPEAEKYIMGNSHYAYLYAKHIIKGRWPEAEKYIMKSPKWAYWYAKDIIKGRWPEAELYLILDDERMHNYRNEFGVITLDIIKPFMLKKYQKKLNHHNKQQ